MYHAGFISVLPNSLNSVYKFLLDGGVFMFCLLLLSFLSVAVILMKSVSLREGRVVPKGVQKAMNGAQEYINANDVANNPPHIAAVLTPVFPSSLSKAGITGPINPIPIESMMTVIIKKVLAWIIFIIYSF